MSIENLGSKNCHMSTGWIMTVRPHFFSIWQDCLFTNVTITTKNLDKWKLSLSYVNKKSAKNMITASKRSYQFCHLVVQVQYPYAVLSTKKTINFVFSWWKFNNPALSTKTKRWLMICVISPLLVQLNSALAQFSFVWS